MAVFNRSHEHAHAHAASESDQSDDMLAFLAKLLFERERASFFYTIVLEVSAEPELRKQVAEHAQELVRHVAHHFGRQANDADVALFVDTLRGMSLRMLLEAECPPPDLAGIAERFGLAAPR